jgi:hypothetical protein
MFSSSIPKITFPKNPIIFLGCSNKDSFRGNIGPTLFTKYTDISLLQSRTNEILSERNHDEADCFLSLFPWIEQKSYFSGIRIPYVSSISDILDLDVILPQLFPLFLFSRCSTKTNIREGLLINLLNVLFDSFINSSQSFLNEFIESGHFLLISGIFYHLPSSCFSKYVVDNLFRLYSDLVNEFLKIQMEECLIFNFPFWHDKSPQIQLLSFFLLFFFPHLS